MLLRGVSDRAGLFRTTDGSMSRRSICLFSSTASYDGRGLRMVTGGGTNAENVLLGVFFEAGDIMGECRKTVSFA